MYTVNDWISKHKNLIECFKPEDIFNTDKTGLFNKCMAQRPYCFNGQKCYNGEQSKKCITSNRKSLPGVMTVRGCAYAGSKGVVWGPIKDMIHVSHGPVGCGQYSRAGRRNYYVGVTGINAFGTMNFKY